MQIFAARPARVVALALGCVLFGALAAPVGTAFARAIQDVFVKNDEANPVVTEAIGTTQVEGNVGITGQPSVQVANVPTVRSALPETINITARNNDLAAEPFVCSNMPLDLPDGVPVLIDFVAASFRIATPADAPLASLAVSIKTGDTEVTSVELPIPVTEKDAFGFAGGVLDPGALVVTKSSFPDAEVGQAFRIRGCASRGSASSTTSVEMAVFGELDPA